MSDWQPGDRVKWRRRGERIWKKGTVRRVYNDADGSVSIWDKRGQHAAVPNSEDCIKARKP